MRIFCTGLLIKLTFSPFSSDGSKINPAIISGKVTSIFPIRRFLEMNVKNFESFVLTSMYGTQLLSYSAVNALYGVVISIYDVANSIYYVVISIHRTVVSLYGAGRIRT